MERRKKYMPQQHVNPVVLSKKLEKLSIDLEHHKNLLLSVNKANDLHVEHLSNFVRHDMKNAIQALNGIVYNAVSEGKLDVETKKEFETVQKLLTDTLEGFAHLIPSTKNLHTTLPEVLKAVEMLSRGDLQKQRIEYRFDYDRSNSTVIKYPFQSLVQVLHNLVINAANSVVKSETKKILVESCIIGQECKILVYDTGPNIEEDVLPHIYNYGYSTTGGSGVGLFHAKCVVEELGGELSHSTSENEEYKKCFILKFKINEHTDEG